MAKETVTINGRQYDKHTGMPLKNDSAADVAKHHANSVHDHTAHSKTLDRRYVKRPDGIKKMGVTAKSPSITNTHSQITTAHASALKTNQMHKFSPNPLVKRIDDIAGPSIHPMVQTVHAAQAAKHPAKTVSKPSNIIKNEAIKDALDHAPSHHRTGRTKQPKADRRASSKRRMTLVSGGAALLLIGGYFTYLNMPNLSVRVAAIQAGINASYPSYQPNGYSVSGPVAYESGKVEMKFASNGTNQSFVLNEERSGWDSTAVLEEYVTPLAGQNYSVTNEGGLTIYTWNGNAAWVSGGILYTITGDSSLAPDQVRRMAISM